MVSDKDIARKIRHIKYGTLDDVYGAWECVRARLDSRDDSETARAFREVLDRYRAELTSPSDRGANEPNEREITQEYANALIRTIMDRLVAGHGVFPNEQIPDIERMLLDYRAELTPPSDREAATAECLARKIGRVLIEKNGGEHNAVRCIVAAALDAARRDEREKITRNDKALSEWVDEITEAYCREGEEDVPPIYDIVRNMLNAGYGRGYNDAEGRVKEWREASEEWKGAAAEWKGNFKHLEAKVKALEEAGSEMAVAGALVRDVIDKAEGGRLVITAALIDRYKNALDKLAALVAEEVENNESSKDNN